MSSIAIIGTGPTAIYTARALFLEGRNLSITMFESQQEAGKGTPYHQDWNDSAMLANIASIEIPPVMQKLVDWLACKEDGDLHRMGVLREDIDERAFFPRVVLGEYFQEQLYALLSLASACGNSIAVKTRHHVQDVRVAGDGIVLNVTASERVFEERFDHVVMATGHAWPTVSETRPGYFVSPWPAHALRTIGECHVGIRGTSLSAIDAVVTLAIARGGFYRDENGALYYAPEPGTENFHVTMMSRKGLLPEADFYFPLPHTPLAICTQEAVDRLILTCNHESLLDATFALFKTELAACDPAYAKTIDLAELSLEGFCHAYFHERERHDPFEWAEMNLKEAKENQANQYTVPWRYAILRMHEVIARIVPHLATDDYVRFNENWKQIFMDDYATVPHESIERLLALHRAGKLDILKLGTDYTLDIKPAQGGAILQLDQKRIHFPAFVEATGQRSLSAHEFPFQSLWDQGIVQSATTKYLKAQPEKKSIDVGGIALDADYHPVSDSHYAKRIYCLSLPFMLGHFPFAQGITSSHEMGTAVGQEIVRQLAAAENPSHPDSSAPWVARTATKLSAPAKS